MTLDVAPQVRILREDETIVLPESIACATGFVGLDPWLNFVHKTYHFPVYRIVSEVRNDIDGWLALARVKHLIFGNYLTTSPFGSYGGFAYSSINSRAALLEKARWLGNELGVEYVNIRFDSEEEPPNGWTPHPIYATYLVNLSQDPDPVNEHI